MSNSGYSKLVYGVTIRFKSTEYEQIFKRFDSKTGKPIDLKSPAFQLEAYTPDGVLFAKLPADTLAMVEEIKGAMSYEARDWQRRRQWERIHAWLLSLGIPSNDSEKLNVFGYFWGPREECGVASSIVIGCIIAAGSSYSKNSVAIEDNSIIAAKGDVATGLAEANLPDWQKYATLELHTHVS